ncbi:MAG: TIGR00269 family protein [Nitrososphaerota archaeon]
MGAAGFCTVCGESPSIYFRRYSGERLCARCFCSSIVERVRRTISKYDLLRYDDRIVVGVSGGKDSLSLLKILHRIERDFPHARLYAVTIDEGIEGYRSECARIAEEFSSSLGIPFTSLSFEALFGFSLSEVVESGAAEKIGVQPCTICGVLRRKALVIAARRLGATVIATAHTLDDIVQTYLLNLLKGEGKIKPVGLRREGGGAVPRVAPFRLTPQREVALYAYLQGIPFQTITCPYTHMSMRDRVRSFLNWYSANRPEALYSLLNNFERLILRVGYGGERACEVCGEPSSRRVCRACELEQRIKDALGA